MFRKCAGTSRFVYNWGLAEWQRQYEVGEKPSQYGLRGQFNGIKDEECPWIREIPYAVTEAAFYSLDLAFKNYFRQKKDGTVARRIETLKRQGKWKRRVAKLLKRGRKNTDPGYPQFKKRGHSDSFQLKGTKVEHDRVYLSSARNGPSIGWVRLKERGYIPTTDSGAEFGVYATVSRRADRWFISMQVEEEIPALENGNTLILGVDFGLKALAVCSDGTVFENPHALRQEERKLARLQRELSRRQKGGQNWRKTKRKIGRCHARIANIRKHALHQVSHYITAKAKPSMVVLEDLNVSGMMQNHHLSKAISDVGFYELRRQTEYKADWNGVKVLIADRFYPSSKTCSECGAVKSVLKLSERIYVCSECGVIIDRDLNAAMNLAALAEGQNMAGLPVELGCNSAPL